MGVSASKIGKHVETTKATQEGSIPSTPILTHRNIQNNELDPRSPSTFISRTPIEVLSAAAKKLEVLNDKETPIRNKYLILGVDPRSPTCEFKRTPIIINAGDKELPKVILNKNLEKVLQSELKTPKINKVYTDSKVIPPKLLESSPIQPKAETYKRRSFVGLLETNLDFTETDIDVVFQEKCRGNGEISNHPNRIDVVEKENVDPRSPTVEFLRTPIQIIKKVGEIDLNSEDDTYETEKAKLDTTENVTVLEVNQEKVPEEESANIEEYIYKELKHEQSTQQSPIDTNEDITPEAACLQESITENASEVVTTETPIKLSLESMNSMTECNNVAIKHEEILHQTKSAPVSPPQMNLLEEILPQKRIKSAPVTPPENNLIPDCNLERKLTQLIYEDDDIVVCPRVVQLKDYQERSPLRIWNGAEPERKKLAQKLKVSDRPRKVDYTMCKIPVFKDTLKKNSVQCENTPPRNKDIRKKLKESMWDNADKTLYL